MAACAECSAPLADDANFCPKCGTKVARERRCHACNAVVGADDRFCAACGAPQQGAPPARRTREVVHDAECTACEHFREAALIEPRLPRDTMSDVVSEAHSQLTEREADFVANEAKIKMNLIASNQEEWGQKPFASSFCAEHAASNKFEIWEVKNRVNDCGSFKRRASQVRHDCFECARRTSRGNPYAVLQTLSGKVIEAKRKDLEQQEATEIKSVFSRKGHHPSRLTFHDICQYFSAGQDYVAVPYPNQYYDCVGFEPRFERPPDPVGGDSLTEGNMHLTSEDRAAAIEAAVKLSFPYFAADRAKGDEELREQFSQIVRAARGLQGSNPARAACLMELVDFLNSGKKLEYPDYVTGADRAWMATVPEDNRIVFVAYPAMMYAIVQLQKHGDQQVADVFRQTILEECMLMCVTPKAMTTALNLHRILLREGIYIEPYRAPVTKAIKLVEDHIRRQEMEARGNPNFELDALRGTFAVYSLPAPMEKIAEQYEARGVGRGLFAYQPCDERQEEGLRMMARGNWMYSGADGMFLFERHMEHLLTIDHRLQQYWQAVQIEQNALKMHGPITSWTEPAALFETTRFYNFAFLQRLKRQFNIADEIPVGIESWMRQAGKEALKKENSAIHDILFPAVAGGMMTAPPLKVPGG